MNKLPLKRKNKCQIQVRKKIPVRNDPNIIVLPKKYLINPIKNEKLQLNSKVTLEIENR